MVTRPVHVESLVHYYVNEVRSDRGLRELDYDADLAAIARSHSSDMVDRVFFSHTTPEGRDIGDRYRAHEYHVDYPRRNRWGENIAQRSFPLSRIDRRPEEDRSRILVETAQAIVDQWLNSPEHRKNLLDENWKREGIGASVRESTTPEQLFVTQNFS
ncbi:CAP domain-containing protein [Halobellus marinus]|jgi:uncharacterized protein YkwD|uniref:CAP domain-containing protein n=1 Tax=Halobellus TaxID=1073986 RepID=UPI0028B17D33|nr:CAP domain-containing protein [Halobellus sp. DFY28]